MPRILHTLLFHFYLIAFLYFINCCSGHRKRPHHDDEENKCYNHKSNIFHSFLQLAGSDVVEGTRLTLIGCPLIFKTPPDAPPLKSAHE